MFFAGGDGISVSVLEDFELVVIMEPKYFGS
jgi:hypothetical protein